MDRKNDSVLITVGIIFSYISAVLWFLMIFTIPLGILNIIAAGKLKGYQEGSVDKQQAIGWSIYLCFGTWIVGGLCALIGVMQSEGEFGSSSKSSLESQLKELNRLYDQGLITKEEYEARRKKIIEDI